MPVIRTQYLLLTHRVMKSAVIRWRSPRLDPQKCLSEHRTLSFLCRVQIDLCIPQGPTPADPGNAPYRLGMNATKDPFWIVYNAAKLVLASAFY
jgi:hypothetical protein